MGLRVSGELRPRGETVDFWCLGLLGVELWGLGPYGLR